MKGLSTNTTLREDVFDGPYAIWKNRPTATNLNRVVSSLNPVINSALTTYGGGNISPILRGKARTLAVGAVKSFDPTRGASLKSHVMLQLQPIGRFSNRAVQPVSISERRLRQVAELSKAEHDFYERHGRDATDDELADRLGLSTKKLGRIRTYAVPTVQSEQFGPQAEDPTTNRPDPINIWLDYLYHDLDATDRKILEWKLGRGGRPVLPNVEIARRLKITPSAVTQRTARMQARLEASMGDAV